MDTRGNVLGLAWTFGFNHLSPGGVHNLTQEGTPSAPGRKALFYASSHTGVIYDWNNGKQQLLQGHCNEICTTTTSSDKRWLVTADKGPNSVLIVWDIFAAAGSREQSAAPMERSHSITASSMNAGVSALPVKTMFDLHGGAGVSDAAFSADSRYLITLGNDEMQTLVIWDWTTDSESPICQIQINGERQQHVVVNPEDSFEIMTTGHRSVYFITWDREGEITQHTPILSSKDFKHSPSHFTYSQFMPGSSEAITATADGDLIVWMNKSLNNLSLDLERGKKAAIKFMRIHGGPINYMTVYNNQYLVTGGEDGFVKVFDLQYRLLIWFEKLKAGPISSISFSIRRSDGQNKTAPPDEDPNLGEFVVATSHAKILLLTPPTALPHREIGLSSRGAVSRETKTGDSTHHTIGASIVTVIMEAQHNQLHCLTAHPKQPKFAVGGYSGLLQVWDYASKSLVVSRQFEVEEEVEEKHGPARKIEEKVAVVEPLGLTTLVFSEDGSELAVGFMNGTVRILDGSTLETAECPKDTQGASAGDFWTVSKSSITHIAFSPCGNYLAAADSSLGVSLLKKETVVGPRKQLEGVGAAIERLAAGKVSTQWVLVGRCQTHYKEIISLLFVPPTHLDNTTHLLSVSADRFVAEYDLQLSSITRGLKLKSLKRIEQVARPLAAAYHPSLHPSKMTEESGTTNDERLDTGVHETFLLTANNEYKFKFHNAATQLCRKTVLGPAFGGPIVSLAIMPSVDGEAPGLVAYSSSERIVGLTRLPLDGNPHRNVGVIAHPCTIAKAIFSYDGTYLLTAGVEDAVVNLWRIQTHALDAQIQLGGTDLEPFLNMLDPSGKGTESPFYREMEDYFYYAQLRSQGEDASTTRLIQDTVNLAEVPSIMQAMGYYPSEQEIENLINEVKYSSLGDGVLVDRVTFAQLIKLYINHKPVVEYTENEVLAALEYASLTEPGHSEELMKYGLELDEPIAKEGLMALLQQYGETMSKNDFELAFKVLLSNHPNYNGVLPSEFTAKSFIEDALGMQATAAPLPPPKTDSLSSRINSASSSNAARAVSVGGLKGGLAAATTEAAQ